MATGDIDINLRVKTEELAKLDAAKVKLAQLKEQQKSNNKELDSANAKLAFYNSLSSKNTELIAKQSAVVSNLKNKQSELAKEYAITNAEVIKLKASTKALEEGGSGLTKGFKKISSGLSTIANIIPGIGIAGLVALISGPLIDAFIGVSEQTRKAKKDLEDWNKSINDAKAGAIATGAQLQAFVNVAKDATLPLQQRNEALKEANKILGEHGEKLTLVNIATAAVTREVQLFTQALVAQAVAAKFTDKVADLTIAKDAALQAYNITVTKAIAGEELLRTIREKQAKGQLLTAAERQGISGATTAIRERITAAQELIKVNNDLNASFGDLNRLTLESTKAFAELGTKEKEIKVKEVKIKPAKVTIDIIGANKIQFADKLDTTIEFDLKLQPKTTVAQAISDLLKKDEEDIKKRLESFKDSIGGVATDIGTAIGDAFGNALSGKGNLFADLFKGVFSSLGAGLRRLGIEFLAASKLIAAIKAAIVKTPALSIVASIGLIALGTFIQGLASKIPGFAGGVRNFGGGLAMVGERGPELLSLPVGANVTPNHQLGGIGGSQSLGLTHKITLEGPNLVIWIQRAIDQYNRNN